MYTLLDPTIAGDLINGFVQQYKETGWIPQWSTTAGPLYGEVTGTDSDVAFADAYLKGVANFDVTAAYDSALKDATVASGPGGRDQLTPRSFSGTRRLSTGRWTGARKTGSMILG